MSTFSAWLGPRLSGSLMTACSKPLDFVKKRMRRVRSFRIGFGEDGAIETKRSERKRGGRAEELAALHEEFGVGTSLRKLAAEVEAEGFCRCGKTLPNKQGIWQRDIRMHPIRFSLALVLVLAASAFAQQPAPPNPANEYEARTFSADGKTLNYRFLKPKGYDAAKKYPLVLFLHGAGERGTDNVAQLRHGASLFLKPEVREKFPCFVVAPQCPRSRSGRTSTGRAIRRCSRKR